MRLILVAAPMSVHHPFRLAAELSAAQLQRARTLSDRLRGSVCWTAPGTSAVALALGMQPNDCPALGAQDFRRWPDMTLDEIAASDPESLSLWTRDPEMRPDGGTSLIDLCTAVRSWLDQMASCPANRVVALATPIVLRAVLVSALDLPPIAGLRLDIQPLVPIHLAHDGLRWTWRPGTLD
ncbi:bifunctional RNase H/acid phosphatase (plasmid) [Antarctobacter heliothermus]|uniref:Bifunctional RNase H/acid phosphatase n=1 Tax=Antarctobacter heliothermus TaxID=74033 RepID=A0A222EB56_9RHOB|nr:histidine phosphatase family protein [Antarctobacter heliothermus]ASP23423.1 bifunctional RNase H/acid phosphatase [Antarctobacter heliothermus]MBT52209.1 hypothetical protein [Mameliella sp.]|tara:strand:- start:140 stop:682 length:543 start_codon:yes stop_codon:yes gene_type:complete